MRAMSERLGDLPAWPEWLSIGLAARYASLCERTIGKLLRDPIDPLPSVLIGRSRRIRRADLDGFLLRRVAAVSQPKPAAAELRNRTGRSLV